MLQNQFREKSFWCITEQQWSVCAGRVSSVFMRFSSLWTRVWGVQTRFSTSMDESLCFTPDTQQLEVKLRIKLGFFFRIKSRLSCEAKEKLVATSALSELDDGDVVHWMLPATELWGSSQTFSHHCVLQLDARPRPSADSNISKAAPALLPDLLQSCIFQRGTGSYCLCFFYPSRRKRSLKLLLVCLESAAESAESEGGIIQI